MKKITFIVFTLISILFIFVIYIRFFHEPIEPICFNSNKWKTTATGTNKVRYSMTEDLFKNHKLIGMSKDELLQLLGAPTETDKFQDWDFKYVLGPSSGMGIDFMWLLIKFDTNEKVIKHTIVSD